MSRRSTPTPARELTPEQLVERHAFSAVMNEQTARDTFSGQLEQLSERCQRLLDEVNQHRERDLPRVRSQRDDDDTFSTLGAIELASRVQHLILWALPNMNLDQLATRAAALERAQEKREQLEVEHPAAVALAREQLERITTR
jgi:hypothetical protein